MNKNMLTFAILCTSACAAHAQSSVTLYGIVDAGFAYSNNVDGNKLYAASSGNMQGSRWGLRGIEDLGNGLKARFILENGFNVYTGKFGQGGDEFGRQANVSLISEQIGTLTIGRQYDSVVDFLGAFEAANQWATAYAAHPGDLDNFGNSNRTNNALKLTSLSYGGLKFSALYSLGGVPGQYNRNQIWSGGIGYAHGPLTLGAAYLNVKNPNYAFFGNNATSSSSASNMSASQIYSGYASAKTQQVFAVGGAYAIGNATIDGTYSNTQFKGLGQTPVTGQSAGAATAGNAKINNIEIDFRYQLNPALTLGAAYDYTKAYSVSNEKVHQGMLGADYFLSVRTDVYVDAIYQHASGRNSMGQQASAQIYTLDPSSTANQFAAIVGIRHKF